VSEVQCKVHVQQQGEAYILEACYAQPLSLLLLPSMLAWKEEKKCKDRA